MIREEKDTAKAMVLLHETALPPDNGRSRGKDSVRFPAGRPHGQ
jgi:hypothetical protein